MRTKMIRTLVKKEMLDVFRDKKTVIMMLLVPVILYPLIFVGVLQLMSFISSSMETQNYRIAVDAEDEDVFLHKLLEKAKASAEPEGTDDQQRPERRYPQSILQRMTGTEASRTIHRICMRSQ